MPLSTSSSAPRDRVIASPLVDRPTLATAVIASVGLVGATCVTWSSYTVGALPGHEFSRADATGPYRWLYEAGVGLMLLAWLALGRLALDRTLTGMTRRVCWAAVAMAAPLLAAAPVNSQDVWYYLGQGNVVAHGLDPYAVGPNAVPGVYLDAVSPPWVGHTSPYGGWWVWICRLVVGLVGPHPWAGMFVLRILAAASVAVMGLALVRLCRATDARPEAALWLTVAGPFPLLMLVGGIHNDAEMLAGLTWGLVVAATGRSMWRSMVIAAVVVGAAATVKAPALIALPFLPLVWYRYAPGSGKEGPAPTWPRWCVTAGVAVAVGVLTVVAISMASGFGLGWISTAGMGTVGNGWLSVPHLVGSWLPHLVPGLGPDDLLSHPPILRRIGGGFLVVTVGAVLLTAWRRPPLRVLAVVMLLLVVSDTAPRGWYLLWPLVVVACDLGPALLAGVAGATAALALWFAPASHPPVPFLVLLALFVPLWGVAALVVRAAQGVPLVPGVPRAGSARV